MDPELLRLLLEILRSQNTTGSAAVGGDVPYDDYDVLGSIGGLGAVGPPAMQPGTVTRQPATSVAAATGQGPTPLIGGEVPFVPEAQTWLPYGPYGGAPPNGNWADIPIPPPKTKTPVFVPPPEPTGPVLYEDWSMNNPFTNREPRVPVNARDWIGAPGLPQNQKVNPVAPKQSKPKGREAAQQITRQAQSAQPQRQYSAPAPQRQAAFTPAPAPRAAAQATLANALNTLRSLSRR